MAEGVDTSQAHRYVDAKEMSPFLNVLNECCSNGFNELNTCGAWSFQGKWGLFGCEVGEGILEPDGGV